MAYRDKYEVLGVIVALATNGLSIYKKGEDEGQISGGSIGDVVVRSKNESGFAAVSIISEQEWESMPQNEAAEAEMKKSSSSAQDLAPQLAKATNECERLRAEILDLKGESEHFKEECASLQERLSVAAGENLALTQKISQLEAENKKLKEASKKAEKNRAESTSKPNEPKDLNLGGNE